MSAEERVLLQRELPHSIELTRNAKGDYQWTIKMYFETTEAAPVGNLKALDAWLRDNFAKETPS